MTSIRIRRKHACRARLVGFAAALAVAPHLHAGEMTGPTVVITEGRAALPTLGHPGLVTVVDREEIARSRAATLAEVLSGQPGVQVTDLYGDGTQARVDMRGFGATAGSNVLVLVDGQRLNNSSDIANPALQRIPVDRIERVEIIRGSAGVLYGNQAVGGVVNVVTRNAGLPGAFLEGAAGSYDTFDGVFGVSTTIGANTFLRIDGDYRDTDNYRDNNRTRLRHLGARLQKEYGAGVVFGELEAGREKQELPGSLFAPEVAEDRRASAAVYDQDFREADVLSGRLGLGHQINDLWRFQGEANWRREDGEFLASFRAFPGSPATQDRALWSLYPRLVGKVHDRIDLTLGADLEDTDYELVTSFGPQEIDQTIWGLYGIANLQLTDRWRGSLGLRRTGVRNDIRASGDRAELDDAYTLGTAALDFAPGHGWKAFLRADQNIRFATVDEHTNIVFGQPIGISNQPGVSWETGIEWSQRQASLQFTAYRLDLEDEISFNADTFTNTNLDRTSRRGFTVEGTLAPVTGWTLGAQYTFTDGTITDGPFDGNRIPLVARHTGQFHTRGRLSEDVILFAEAIYTGDQVIGGDYRNDFRPLDAFTVVNAAITWEKQGWQLGARVDNLLNEAYNASASVGFDEGFTPQPAFFPAPERRFRISARYDF
jgi:iron complex outermembrane receptor protein